MNGLASWLWELMGKYMEEEDTQIIFTLHAYQKVCWWETIVSNSPPSNSSALIIYAGKHKKPVGFYKVTVKSWQASLQEKS